jgi:hypothetical protein
MMYLVLFGFGSLRYADDVAIAVGIDLLVLSGSAAQRTRSGGQVLIRS